MKPTSRASTIWRESMLLLLIAAVPAFLSVWLHPKRSELTWRNQAVQEVDLATVAHWSEKVLWVDARSASAYAKQHIPGAVRLTEGEWEHQLPGFLDVWQPGIRVVVYCDTQECNASQGVTQRLQRSANLSEIYVLKGGWAAWLSTHR